MFSSRWTPAREELWSPGWLERELMPRHFFVWRQHLFLKKSKFRGWEEKLASTLIDLILRVWLNISDFHDECIFLCPKWFRDLGQLIYAHTHTYVCMYVCMYARTDTRLDLNVSLHSIICLLFLWIICSPGCAVLVLPLLGPQMSTSIADYPD